MMGRTEKNKRLQQTSQKQYLGFLRRIFGFSPIVTTKHDVMKYMENDEYFILFICHFPCPSPIELTHQHPIKWIHQRIFTQRDIT